MYAPRTNDEFFTAGIRADIRHGERATTDEQQHNIYERARSDVTRGCSRVGVWWTPDGEPFSITSLPVPFARRWTLTVSERVPVARRRQPFFFLFSPKLRVFVQFLSGGCSPFNNDARNFVFNVRSRWHYSVFLCVLSRPHVSAYAYSVSVIANRSSKSSATRKDGRPREYPHCYHYC